MACRCVDIANYKADIQRLINAEGYAQSLIQDTNDVRTTLDDMKSEYNSTVQATGEFISEFAKLDEGAQGQAGIISVQIKGAKQTVEQWLKDAEIEDRDYHAREAAGLM